MDAAMASFTFTDPKIKAAAAAFVERYRTSKATGLGHGVGMEVHDVRGPNPPATLEPGMVFTIEPAMPLEDERLDPARGHAARHRDGRREPVGCSCRSRSPTSKR